MNGSADINRVDTLRVSITDRCNLRCIYCMPHQGVPLISHDSIMRYEEILRVVRAGTGLGIRKVRITGGEPLVRKGLTEFVESIADINGIEDLCLTTNGVLLKEYAGPLRRAGMHRVTISLDSLRRRRYERITGEDRLADVLAGIEASITAGLDPLKINVVIIRGINDDEVVDFARLSTVYPLEVRFIERMPLVETDGTKGCGMWEREGMSGGEVRQMVEAEFGPLKPVGAGVPVPGPADLYRVPGGTGRIGFINPVSAPFCATCTRVRLTPEGMLRNCLLREESVDLRRAVRAGVSDDELASVLREAMESKFNGKDAPFHAMRKYMVQIGG